MSQVKVTPCRFSALFQPKSHHVDFLHSFNKKFNSRRGLHYVHSLGVIDAAEINVVYLKNDSRFKKQNKTRLNSITGLNKYCLNIKESNRKARNWMRLWPCGVWLVNTLSLVTSPSQCKAILASFLASFVCPGCHSSTVNSLCWFRRWGLIGQYLEFSHKP